MKNHLTHFFVFGGPNGFLIFVKNVDCLDWSFLTIFCYFHSTRWLLFGILWIFET